MIEVDEEGSEAAAATAVVGGTEETLFAEPKKLDFIADHPFIFFLRDLQTGLLLFQGRLVNPIGENSTASNKRGKAPAASQAPPAGKEEKKNSEAEDGPSDGPPEGPPDGQKDGPPDGPSNGPEVGAPDGPPEAGDKEKNPLTKKIKEYTAAAKAKALAGKSVPKSVQNRLAPHRI